MEKKKEYSQSDIAEMFIDGTLERWNFHPLVYKHPGLFPDLMERNEKRLKMTAKEFAAEPFDRSILWNNPLDQSSIRV